MDITTKLIKTAEQFARFAENPQLILTAEMADELVKDNKEEKEEKDNEDIVVEDEGQEETSPEELVEVADELVDDVENPEGEGDPIVLDTNPEEVAPIVEDGGEGGEEQLTETIDEGAVEEGEATATTEEGEPLASPSGESSPNLSNPPESDFFKGLKDILNQQHSPATERLRSAFNQTLEFFQKNAMSSDDEREEQLLVDDKNMNANEDPDKIPVPYDFAKSQEREKEISDMEKIYPPKLDDEPDEDFLLKELVSMYQDLGFDDPEGTATTRLAAIHGMGYSDEEIAEKLNLQPAKGYGIRSVKDEGGGEEEEEPLDVTTASFRDALKKLAFDDSEDPGVFGEGENPEDQPEESATRNRMMDLAGTWAQDEGLTDLIPPGDEQGSQELPESTTGNGDPILDILLAPEEEGTEGSTTTEEDQPPIDEVAEDMAAADEGIATEPDVTDFPTEEPTDEQLETETENETSVDPQIAEELGDVIVGGEPTSTVDVSPEESAEDDVS